MWKVEHSYSKEEHHKIAMELAQESIVLLKNENNILPINKRKIALIGDMAKILDIKEQVVQQ